MDHRPAVFVLQPELSGNHYAQTLGISVTREAQLRTLARALSVSPIWGLMPRAALAIRLRPNPLLGVVGYFDEADRVRLEWLQRQLVYVLPRLRYVDYTQAEKDCQRLAGRLKERFGHNQLQNCNFTAIPRGGYIVLGMLAYTLGLKRSQLEPPFSREVPLVVVDDLAISGVRFGRFLEHLEYRRVIFAHLYSHPELREAIEMRVHPSVSCVSAHDLREYAPEYQGDDYPAWRKRWLARMDSRGYWVGQTEHVCFAWNEPDTSTWNPVTNREETGWRLIPPELCLKNRLESPAQSVSVQVAPEGEGPLKPSPRVLFGEIEDHVVIGNLDTGESFALSGVGADMWRAVVRFADLEVAANALLEDYEVDSTTLQTDLRTFVDRLADQGLLRYSD